MNVLHINEFDQLGGAATAMWRLHMGLRLFSINSCVMVAHPSVGGEGVYGLPQWRWRDYQLARLGRRLRFPDVFITSTFDLVRDPVFQAADVVHLHNLHHGYFNYLALPKLLRGKRAFLTLHDMWAVTGHCSYSNDCVRWQTGCGRCPYPNVYPAMRFDTSALEWKLKQLVLTKVLNGLIVQSRWMESIARKSFLKKIPIYRIPYGLDISIYQVRNKLQCKEILGIPHNKFVVMFAAASVTEHRKGGDLLEAALASLPKERQCDITLLVLGKDTMKSYNKLSCQVIQFGFVSNDYLKSITYNAADVFVSSARQEAFGIVLQEAMACGTPCIAFAIGGMTDLVRHEITGLTVTPGDSEELAKAITRLMNDEALRLTLGANARTIVENEYTIEHQAKQVLAVYAGKYKS